jgi:hypothetical protein
MVTRRLILEFFFVFGTAAISACCLAAETVDPSAGGSCTRPAAETQTSVVDVPSFDTSSSDDPAADADAQAAQNLWQAYQTSVFQALAASSDPHDWALASLVYADFTKAEDGLQRDALIRRAAAALPDDLMVQWIALTGGRGNFAKSTSDDALRSLQVLEGENAAVWNEVLIRAARVPDSAAVDVALARMATSTRFDTHWTDAMKRLRDVYRQHPVPKDYVRSASKVSPGLSLENAANFATAYTALAMAFPAFQELVKVCRVNQATGENSSRAGDCATVGRLLAAKGDTLVANRIGLAVLRVSRTFTQDDVERARPDDWVYHQYISIVESSSNAGELQDAATYQNDWFESGSELEAMRLKVLRVGKPLLPPDGWVDENSVFSEARLRDDEEHFKTQALTH